MGFITFLVIFTLFAVGFIVFSIYVQKEHRFTKAATRLASLACLAVIGIGTINNVFVFVDQHEVGYRFNKQTGDIIPLNRSGWILKHPVLEDVHAIDLRPMQVCINANSRVLNCKLVRFNPEGLEVFIKMHGRTAGTASGDYEGSLSDILKSYAYDGSGNQYPFLTILTELNQSSTTNDWYKEFEADAPR